MEIKHFIKFVLALAVTFTIVSASHAGHYTVSYSGGQTKISDSTGVHVYPYGAQGSTWGGTWSQNTAPCTILCAGSITATATWQPDNSGDLPPRAVLLAKIVEVSDSGSGSDSHSGSDRDGHGEETLVAGGSE